MSDGCIYKKLYNYQLSLALQKQDDYIVKILKDKLYIKSNISYYKNSAKISKPLTKADVKILYNLNIYPNKSHLDYTIPNISNKFYSSFIRGYFDGNGCITIKKTGYSIVSICCNSCIFLQTLKEILYKQTNITNISIKIESKKNRKNNLYVLYIYRLKDQKLFGDYIYKNSKIKLTRKYNKFKLIPC